MKAPKVSIIIPCYGVEKYLDRCLESVVHQTLENIEIILVDDCSPDAVPRICDNWAQKDNRIKVIHKTVNQGLGLARNTGLEVAQGDYIAFVDADDYVGEEMYQKLYNEAVSSCADIVFCGMKQELANGHFVCVSDFSERKVFHKNELQELSIRYFDSPYGRNLIMSVWHSVYKRELISDIRFYSEREVCSEDLPFQVMAINKANSKDLHTQKELFDKEQQIEVQIWEYDPLLFSEDQKHIDKISLMTSFLNNHDERLDKELEQFLNDTFL